MASRQGVTVNGGAESGGSGVSERLCPRASGRSGISRASRWRPRTASAVLNSWRSPQPIRSDDCSNMTTRRSNAWRESTLPARPAAKTQRTTSAAPVTPNTSQRTRNTRLADENDVATIAAAAMLTAPSTANAIASSDVGTGPITAIGSNHRRQPLIMNIASTVAAITEVINLRGRAVENAEAIIEINAIAHSATNARDPAGNRLDAAPATTYAVLRAAIRKLPFLNRIVPFQRPELVASRQHASPFDTRQRNSRSAVAIGFAPARDVAWMCKQKQPGPTFTAFSNDGRGQPRLGVVERRPSSCLPAKRFSARHDRAPGSLPSRKYLLNQVRNATAIQQIPKARPARSIQLRSGRPRPLSQRTAHAAITAMLMGWAAGKRTCA